MVVDVIGVFGSNSITVGPEGPGPDPGDPGDPEDSENPQSSVDPKGSEESITDLLSESTSMATPAFFFSISINTVITIRIDFNDRFFNTRKNRPFSDLIEKVMKYDNMK